jgi:transposase
MKFEPVITPGFESREEMRETAVRLRLEGHSKKEIAAALGFKTGGRTLSTWLKDIPAPEWTKRPNAKDDLHALAVEMRKEARSYSEIQKETGLSKSTLSVWLKDIPLTDEQRQALLSRRYANNNRRAAAIKARNDAVRAKTSREAREQIQQVAESELFVAGVIAYMAEGAKQKPWSPGEQVSFMNSDARLIILFMRWLELVGVTKDELTFRVSIHEMANVGEAEEYWAQVVQVPVAKFMRATLKKHNPKTIRRNTGSTYVGCLTVGVRRSSVLNRRIEAWFDGIIAALSSSDGLGSQHVLHRLV